MSIVDPELLKILACPVTHQALREATAEDLESCNAAIAGGAVETVGGTRVEEPLEAALVREDGALLYPIRDGIPVLLADEGIATA